MKWAIVQLQRIRDCDNGLLSVGRIKRVMDEEKKSMHCALETINSWIADPLVGMSEL